MLGHALRVYRDKDTRSARGLFFFSILYLFLIFSALLLDRALTVLA
jgi:heme O synthase-like polyprenyltransferase